MACFRVFLVRTQLFGSCETHTQRAPKRVGGERRTLSTCRSKHGASSELAAFVDAPRRLSRRTQAARKADLTKRGKVRSHGDVPRGRGDRQRDAQVCPRLVDSQAAGNVDEHVSSAKRQPGVAGKHGDDHREPLWINTGCNTPRHRKVGWRDKRLNLDEDRPRSFQRADDSRADLPHLALAKHG